MKLKSNILILLFSIQSAVLFYFVDQFIRGNGFVLINSDIGMPLTLLFIYLTPVLIFIGVILSGVLYSSKNASLSKALQVVMILICSFFLIFLCLIVIALI